MLVLPELSVVHPRTEREAAAALAAPAGEVRVLAGGTDLVPGMKRGLLAPRTLVSLRRVRRIGSIRREDDALVLGAAATLADVASNTTVAKLFPALARAASVVGGPQIRRMGTIGGNVCLETRCAYYDQTEFWRNALGYCLKKDGDVCHVVAKGRHCVAAMVADTAAPLIAYGARVRLRSARGEREIALADFYVADGASNLARTHDELVTAVVLPRPATGVRAVYEKLALRRAIDFPLLSIAVAVRTDEHATLQALTVVVGGLAPRPRVMHADARLGIGRTLDADVVYAVARDAHAHAHPLPHVPVDTGWRREMVATLVTRAFSQLEHEPAAP